MKRKIIVIVLAFFTVLSLFSTLVIAQPSLLNANLQQVVDKQPTVDKHINCINDGVVVFGMTTCPYTKKLMKVLTDAKVPVCFADVQTSTVNAQILMKIYQITYKDLYEQCTHCYNTCQKHKEEIINKAQEIAGCNKETCEQLTATTCNDIMTVAQKKMGAVPVGIWNYKRQHLVVIEGSVDKEVVGYIQQALSSLTATALAQPLPVLFVSAGGKNATMLTASVQAFYDFVLHNVQFSDWKQKK